VERAQEVLSDQGTAPDQPRDEATAQLLFCRGQALAELGRTEEAEGPLTAVFDYRLNRGEPDRAIEVALHPVNEYDAGLPALVARASSWQSPIPCRMAGSWHRARD
jgi:hypothetical protein